MAGYVSPFSNNAPTASSYLGQGARVNLGDPNSVNDAANAAVASSAQSYNQAALVNNGYITDAEGNQQPLKDSTTAAMQAGAFNPQLNPNTQFSYNPIQNNPNSTLGNANQVGPSDWTTQTANAVNAAQLDRFPQTAQGNTQQVNPNQYNTNATNYGARTGTSQGVDPNPYSAANNPASQMNAVDNAGGAHGNVDPNSMIQNQFDQLMDDQVDENGVPRWAETAVTAANQRMNSLGLGASTMAGNATAKAILDTALPMAAANSQVVAQLNSQNLSNDQQAMLSNQAYENAAAQFNAQSKQQNDQFFSNLTANLAQSNAARQDAMSQFNTGQENTASQYNATNAQQSQQFNSTLQSSLAAQNAAQANAMEQFNAGQSNASTQFYSNLNQQANLLNAQLGTQANQFNVAQQNAMVQFLDNLNGQRAEFNAQNQLVVDQSNVQWQRAINTANTAGQNAANQANVMNTFNLQQTDLNNLWQQSRDEASWALTSSENSQNRALTLVNSALNRQTSLDILNSQLQASMYSALGGLGVNILGGLFGGSGANGIGQGIASLFGSSGSPGVSTGSLGGGGSLNFDATSTPLDFGGTVG